MKITIPPKTTILPNLTSDPVTQISDSDIESAFLNGTLIPVYQPQVPLNDHGKIFSVDACVRIQHPSLGMVMPANFLPRIRQMGLMWDLTKALLKSVEKDWLKWQSQGHELQISVNIDYELLSYATLSRELSDWISQSKLPKKRLMLDICNIESDSFSKEAKAQITRLRMKGFRLALDGLGVRPIEEEALIDLPIDQLKIASGVIKQLEHHSEARDIVRSVQYAGDKLGATVVAVGVESNWVLDWLIRQGCSLGQGFLFGPPLSADAFVHIYLANQVRWQVSPDSDRMTLLVLEDDPQYQVLLLDALADTYNVVIATSIAEAKQLVETHEPKLWVVDIQLPDGSGIEFCKSYLDTHGEDAFGAIFVSGSDNLQDRLDAYSAGGVDFIQKPFPMVDLVSKLGRIARFQDKRQKALAQTDQMRNATLGSMREAAHYGDVVQFLKNLFHQDDELGVANELFRFMKRKNLQCSVQFRSIDSTVSYSQSGGACSPMEINIFELLGKRGRIQDFNQRSLFNDKQVSVLIKNMPDDVEEKGRIRDYMAALIEGLEARFEDMLRRRALDSVSEELNALTQELSESLELAKARNIEILDKATIDLQLSFHLLNLTEEQEAHITQIVETMHASAEESEGAGRIASERVKNISQLLARLSDTGNANSRKSTMEADQDDGCELF